MILLCCIFIPFRRLKKEKSPVLGDYFILSDRRGSNPRPAAWEAAALPTELLSQMPSFNEEAFRLLYHYKKTFFSLS